MTSHIPGKEKDYFIKGIGNYFIPMREKTTRKLLYTIPVYAKINLTWLKNLNVKGRNKLFKNIRILIISRQEFLKALIIIEIINKSSCIKITNLLPKDTIKNLKGKVQIGRRQQVKE